MNQSRAKKIRKKAYGDFSKKIPVEYFKIGSTVVAKGRRRLYKVLKKEYKNGL